MKKTYIITFSISVMVMFSIVIITLMLMLPQSAVVMNGTVKNYEKVNKSDYTYSQSKDVNKESLLRQYNVTSTAIDTFENKNQYNPGNSDPFSVINSTDTSTGTGTSTNTSTNTSTTTKTTNSNGGVENPDSSNK